jgi:hypothetical protein
MNGRNQRSWLLALSTCLAGCVNTITIVDNHDVQPLVQQIDATVGKSFSGDARTAVMIITPIARADIGKISVARFDDAFDKKFRRTVTLSQWPPWQVAEMEALDGIIELERVDAQTNFADKGYEGGALLLSYRVCLHESRDRQIACWDAQVSQPILRKSLDCAVNISRCVEPAISAAVDSGVANILLQMENDPAVLGWVSGLREKAMCDRSGGCIGLLWWPAYDDHAGYSFAKDIEGCLTRRINELLPDVTLIGRQRLQRLLYPLMEPDTEPRTEQEFAALLHREDVHERLASRGIRFLVAFSGQTTQDEWKGGILCGGGYGGAGCLGFVWADKRTGLDAAIWDLAAAGAPGHAAAVVEGTSAMPAVILPIPIPAATQSAACRTLGDQISGSISSKQ